MDKETLGSFGWVIIAIIIIGVLLAAASPLGEKALGMIKDLPNNIKNAVGIGVVTLPEDSTAEPLDAPQNLMLSESDALTWDAVLYADGYLVTMSNGYTIVTKSVDSIFIDLSDLIIQFNGYAFIEVRATSTDPAYANSEPAVYILNRMLAEVTNITMNASCVLSWSEVANANKYTITLESGVKVATEEHLVDLSEYFTDYVGTSIIRITASDSTGRYSSSTASYTAVFECAEDSESFTVEFLVDTRSLTKPTGHSAYNVVVASKNCDDNVAGEAITFPSLSAAMIEEMAAQGYMFAGWKGSGLDETVYQAGGIKTLYQDQTFVAQWARIANKYFVSIERPAGVDDATEVDGYTTIATITITLQNDGTVVYLPTYKKDDVPASGWLINGEKVEGESVAIVILTDTTCSPYWD